MAHALGSVVTRAGSGLVKQVSHHAIMLTAAVVLTATGLGGLVFAVDPLQLCAAMATLGAAFGLAQNPAFLLLLLHAPDRGVAAVSSVWNFAYDSGLGLGALAFGLAVQAGSGLMPLLVFAAGIVGLIPFIARSARPARS
jgi:predicted MFS family arabinose efflux permease